MDIVQNTIVDGQWTFIKTINPESELPQVGDFFLLDARPVDAGGQGKTIRINGGDGRAAELSTSARARNGSSGRALNTFAHYITKSVEFTGSVEGGQYVVEAEIEPISNQAVGVVPEDSVCEVKTILPRPCIPTNDGSKPVVDDDGYLWYDEQTKKLYVSDWDDEQNSNGEAEWSEVGGSAEATGDFVSLYGNNVVEQWR